MAGTSEGGKKAAQHQDMSEKGRKGGEARADKHSHEELSEQAKRSATTVENERPGFHSEIGAKGGKAQGGQQGGQRQEEPEEEE